MRIKQAKTAGFCFGVDRAVNLAYETAEKGVKACSLGPLIHNDTVTDSLREKGIGIIGTPEEAESGETVIIRAHGVAPGIYEALGAKGAQICDATCPVVKKIHNIVTAESSPDIPVLIAGNADHPEVIGIRGYCKGESFTFNIKYGYDQILFHKINPSPYMMYSFHSFLFGIQQTPLFNCLYNIKYTRLIHHIICLLYALFSSVSWKVISFLFFHQRTELLRSPHRLP